MFVWLLCGSALGYPSTAGADERSEIAAQRVAAQASYLEREEACKGRFAVTACIDAARRERRAALDALRARQIPLDEQRRQERAEVRRKELAEKAADDARRERGRSESPAVTTTPAAATNVQPPASSASARERVAVPEKVRRAPRVPAKPASPRKAKPTEATASREARERAHRQSYDEKERAAREHREQSINATLRRLSEKPPASSLPIPGSASGARPAGR